ncbi:MAG: tetratricopeptide repeat protein, partial [Leptospiraceae bacterium]|nr:tetratricopeptide repeat protein [Leptospiraceae bacterium]
SDLELNYQVAEIYRVQKNEKQSVVYYTRVLHVAAPGDFRSSYYRGNALWKLALHYVAVKDPELAAAYALQFLQEHPESLGARYLLGAGVYFENGQYNQSLPHLLRLDRVSPAARKDAGIDNARMQFMIGQMLMMRFDPRAITYFSRCKDKNSLAEQYWLLLTDQSVHSFRPLLEFIRNHPEHLPSRVALLYLLKRNNTKDYAEELINVSELAAAQKQWDTGWKVIQIARDLKSSNPDLPIAWFDIHRLAGLHLTELDQPHRALIQIEKAIEAGDKDQVWKDESDRASFIEQLAALYSNPSIRRMDDARSILQSQLKKMPDRADTYISLGFVEWKDHRLPQALEALQKGQSLQPDRIEYRLVLSMLQSEMGDLKNAEAGYKEVLQKRPDLAPALNSLGYLYTQQGVDLENARALIERAVTQDPANPAYRDSLGWVYFQSGDYLQARFHLEMASTLMQSRGEESPEIYEHLGDVYEKLGMTLAALEAYRNALKVNHGPAKRPEPWSTEIQKKIDRIKGNSK